MKRIIAHWRAAGVSRPVNPRGREADASRSPRRSGFTLVELLVAVALAIIVLTMFAQVYSWSTETYSTQKGIRRNDQRARMLMTVIKGDLENRTFRDVVPFWPGQDSTSDILTGTGFLRDQRRGYFCISENDPDNNTDDVLFLTIEIPRNNSQRWYTGRAQTLTPGLAANHNQPEGDDGVFTSENKIAASRAAEVAYFLRNGNLYRRVLLIRDPYDGTDPQAGLTGDYVKASTTTGDGYFWRDFAISAYYRVVAGAAGIRINGITALQNNSSTVVGPDGYPTELGIPSLRFGYSLSRPSAGPNFEIFLPREYVPQVRDSSNAVVTQSTFFGRFVEQETCDPNFLYPGALFGGVATNDPHTRTPLTLNQYPSDTRFGTVEEYSTVTPAPHRGEDILMANVHQFDVKVWDGAYNEDANSNGVLDPGEDLNGNGILDTAGGYVDLGHSATSGFYQKAFNNYGGAAAPKEWNRFDTWHPYSRMGANPPYKATGAGTGQATGAAAPALGSTDERPLLAIQITIRFYDTATKQMRQLTIQHSLKK